MSQYQSIPFRQGLLFFFEEEKHELQDRSTLPHILLPQFQENARHTTSLASRGALYPFYTPSDPLVLDEEVFVSPIHPLEWRRRSQQVRMLMQHFRFPFPEQRDGFPMKRVLDLAIDPNGEWLRQCASYTPTTEVIGLTSQEMYARQATFFAVVQGCRNVFTQVCPLTQPLPFPDESMDLISGSFLHATLPEYAWPLLLEDCFRLLRPGGVLRLLECVQGESTSAAAGTLYATYWQQMDRLRAAARPSAPGTQTIRSARPERLPTRMEKTGFVAIAQQESLHDFSAGTPFHGLLREQADDFFQLLEPFCTAHACARETYQQAYHEMQLEMLEPTFRGYWHLCTTWGYKPSRHILRPIPDMHVEQPFPQVLYTCSLPCSLSLSRREHRHTRTSSVERRQHQHTPIDQL
ncbi:class I SAM-dependent methyltransferase [Ktedonobacter racemifer]|uniref:Methyltransferase type 11 n=1 Tax=Ktedonobacter racemifer DSM 44963 TaxID=485913 RepID=D6TX32_KTERA|nr:class I SAM-dependent methyltransferase [Ktedonobacter racemifer]EFH84765.1 Methyltransferase type 11 [Ktedonobacter racemifer DSM 44963]